MLFAVKNRIGLTLGVLATFVADAVFLCHCLDLSWNWEFHPTEVLLAAAAMAVSDSLIHGVLTLSFGARYLGRYRALVEYFRSQQLPQIVAGSLLAGGEELVFRGVLLEGLRTVGGFSTTPAVVLSAVLFGLFHALPSRQLLPFALWAFWEGLLLGLVYVVSGSLLVVVVVHVLHDLGGFSLFAYQRRVWQHQTDQNGS